MVQCDRDCIQFDGSIILNLSVKWGVKLLTLHYK